MCGIVGYVGGKSADEILLDGLKKLEYRGYDSAGIATESASGGISITKTRGKVAKLGEKIAAKKCADRLGIGHTRWATHGEPSEKNAHPHRAGAVTLVHNGIIENFRELKSALGNYDFYSDTDSEVLAALVDSCYEDSLLSAISAAAKKVRGTFAIAAISPREPGKIFVARRGSPLVIGLGDGENLAASDVLPLIGRAKTAIYLRDGDVAEISRDKVRIFDADFHEVSRPAEPIETDVAALQKNGFAHFLLKEIMEQPASLGATLQGRIRENAAILDEISLPDSAFQNLAHLVIVGCGTAYYAGMTASYFLERMLPNVTIDVVIASEFRYRAARLPRNSLALVISQSGETADTLACLRAIKSQNVKVVGVVNTAGSTIARECDDVVYLRAGVEVSVASTKAFTSQVAALILFGARVAETQNRVENSQKMTGNFAGKSENSSEKFAENSLENSQKMAENSAENRENSAEITAKFLRELEKLPSEIQKLLEEKRGEIAKLAQKYAKFDHVLYLGRGAAYPVALEGALKLKETSYVDANGYAAGELKHGPIALVDERFFAVFVLSDDELLPKSLSNLSEINARGGRVVALTNAKKSIDATDVLRIDTELELLAPLVLNVASQLFAYFTAVARGRDVDQPRNLAKSVTVE